MSTPNVVPIDESAALHRQTIEFAEWLAGQLRANRVSCFSVRGVDADGEPFMYDMIPVNAETLRYMMVGMLEEAKSLLTLEP